MNVLKRGIPTLLIGLFVLFSPGAALAATDLLNTGGNGGVCAQAGTSSSVVCSEHTKKDNPLTGCPSHCGTGILYDITNIVAFVGGAAAVIIMIVGALRFASSGTDTSTNSRTDNDVENARRTIASAVIGLVVIVMARFLIEFVLGKL